MGGRRAAHRANALHLVFDPDHIHHELAHDWFSDNELAATDVYLLGLAQKNRGRLATFDRSIPLGAVSGATRDTLAVVGPVEDD